MGIDHCSAHSGLESWRNGEDSRMPPPTGILIQGALDDPVPVGIPILSSLPRGRLSQDSYSKPGRRSSLFGDDMFGGDTETGTGFSRESVATSSLMALSASAIKASPAACPGRGVAWFDLATPRAVGAGQTTRTRAPASASAHRWAPAFRKIRQASRMLLLCTVNRKVFPLPVQRISSSRGSVVL